MSAAICSPLKCVRQGMRWQCPRLSTLFLSHQWELLVVLHFLEMDLFVCPVCFPLKLFSIKTPMLLALTSANMMWSV